MKVRYHQESVFVRISAALSLISTRLKPTRVSVSTRLQRRDHLVQPSIVISHESRGTEVPARERSNTFVRWPGRYSVLKTSWMFFIKLQMRGLMEVGQISQRRQASDGVLPVS